MFLQHKLFLQRYLSEMLNVCIAVAPPPPILHRKESFLPPGHALVAKFARLTLQEEKHGLLDETATIGTREGWERRLAERGFTVRGHRLVR